MCLNRLIENLLWGSDKWKAERFNRMGDCFYFSFYTFQVIRTIYLFVMIVLTFLMLYFDLRLFIFFIQDWKMLMNWISIALIFAFSGKQRTEIVFRTKAYNVKEISLNRSSDGIDHSKDYEIEQVQGYKAWKTVILLYELAQTLSLYHTIVFFSFFYSEVYNYYYNVKKPQEQINKDMRILIMWLINTIPPLVMIFDMVFSKILFRLRHFWVGLLCSVVFLGIQYLGRHYLLKDEFPKHVEEFPEVWHRAMAVIGFVSWHVILWIISLIKVRVTKDPARIKKDLRLEKLLKKYDDFLKAIERRRREEIHDQTHDSLLISDQTPKENYQIPFMREVLYNYLDKELKLSRQD